MIQITKQELDALSPTNKRIKISVPNSKYGITEIDIHEVAREALNNGSNDLLKDTVLLLQEKIKQAEIKL